MSQFLGRKVRPLVSVFGTEGQTSCPNSEVSTDKPVGVAPADNLDPDTLTVEIKGPDGEALNPRDGYEIKYIAVPTVEEGKGESVVSDVPAIDLPLPSSGEVKYSIKVEVK